MCDYSLHGLPNRLAVEGEELVAHRFITGAIGLTSPAELCRVTAWKNKSEKRSFWSALKAAIFSPGFPEILAVCVPPGARLRMTGIPIGLQRELGVGEDEIVTFTQTTAMANAYHDAVRFENGRQVLLQVLKEGQCVRVLSLNQAEFDDLNFAWGHADLATLP
jgi:hypothetical protein